MQLESFDGRDLGVDSCSFTKQVLQVWTMRFSKAASAQGGVNSMCPAPVDTPLLADPATMSGAAIDWSIAAAGGGLVSPQEVGGCWRGWPARVRRSSTG